ncbi:hypothetical protein H4S07_003578, partial [Coemansia furcata]
MGQAYSHWNSEHGRQPNDNRQSVQGRAPRGNARRSGRAVRGGNSEREDSGRAESRYSPYTTGPRAASRPTVPEPPQATQAVGDGVATTSGNIEVVQRVSLEIADPLDAERWEQADAEMHDAAAAADLGASEITDVTGTSRAGGTARARVRAGNQLLSRIVSRSIIVAIAQELERRRRAPADPPAAHAGGGVSTYVMDFSSRLNLYYHVSVFILSVLEASIDTPSGDSESGGARTGVENPVAAGLAQQQEAVTVDGASGAGDDPENGLQFRMFLLPGAIDHALAEHASTHTSSDTQTTPPPNDTTPLPNDTAPLPSGQTPEQASGENGRESWHNDREEKLRRLRDIARAMHDERRAIQIPVAVLGLRMNSELRRSTRTALQNLGERIAASEASPAPPSGLQDTIRGLRDRLTNIVPGFMAPQQEPETEEPDIQPAPADAAAAAEQPGMSVFITIHYMQLGNPLMLPMAAYALFPELVADDTDIRSPGNYDLFMEIANILGQVRSTTVSQELVDKQLRKYHYHFD